MVWNANSTAAQNLQFQQIPMKEVLKVFSSTSKEVEMFTSQGRMQLADLEKLVLDGRPVRVDVQDAQATYLAPRFGDNPWLPGSDDDSSVNDQVATPSVTQMNFYAHEAYMQIMYRDTAKTAVKSSSGGYKNLLEFLSADAAEGFKNRLSLMIAGTANGYLARILSAPSTSGYTTVYVEWAGVTGRVGPTVNPPLYFTAGGPFGGARNLLQGGFALDAVDPSTGSLRTGPSARGRWVAIGAVAQDVGTSAAGVLITLTQGHGGAWQAGDYLCLYKSRPDTLPATQAAYRELPGMIGLLDVIGDQTDLPYYGDLQRSSYAFTEALVLDQTFTGGGPYTATSRTLTLELVNYALDQYTQLTGEETSVIYCRPSIMRKLAEFINVTTAASLAQSSPMRWDANARGNAPVGVPGLDITPIGGKMHKYVSSPNAATHSAFFLNPKQLMMIMDKGPINLDAGGDIRVPGKATYQRAMGIRYIGLMARWPKGAGVRIDDLTGSHVAQ